jgi:predicted butyrate kinase (DUF1464 family)
MYIMNTNLYSDILKYQSNIPASVIVSERYFNCENFFSDMNHKKRKLINKLMSNKKR